MNKKHNNLIDNMQDELNKFWSNLSFNNIIHIKTKPVSTNYIQREAEEFYALHLPGRDLPGLPIDITMRVIRLDQPVPFISILPRDWVHSIDGEEINSKKEWKVAGSTGHYTVQRHGDKYYCDCKGFQFRKYCRHSTLIKEQNA